ncbi:hypothetical protein SAMN05192583_3495 [Sphingomonas gellani]|uniref:Uncharacterized protein n=1 Tax=Sphingomonas gellani TaxID=1166340 RepID=A0A1H8J5U3_9SPHN|nr:hypothetical protein SAMN05192583_3495 [Sphingomonas gellani]
MRALDWVLDHKVRTGLIVVALANLCYLLWCAMTDIPTSSFSKLLTPIVILSAVTLGSSEGRNSS